MSTEREEFKRRVERYKRVAQCGGLPPNRGAIREWADDTLSLLAELEALEVEHDIAKSFYAITVEQRDMARAELSKLKKHCDESAGQQTASEND